MINRKQAKDLRDCWIIVSTNLWKNKLKLRSLEYSRWLRGNDIGTGSVTDCLLRSFADFKRQTELHYVGWVKKKQKHLNGLRCNYPLITYLRLTYIFHSDCCSNLSFLSKIQNLIKNEKTGKNNLLLYGKILR